MKLILTAAVDNLGLAGDVVEVKDGYGRNYLVPRGFAMRWSRGGEKQIDGIKRSRDAREIRGLDHANEVRQQIEGLELSVDVRAGESGTLFGSVTPAEVAAAIKKAGGPSVDRRSVRIDKPIQVDRFAHRGCPAARRRHRARQAHGQRCLTTLRRS